MQKIDKFINEGNITNGERKWREFVGLCRGYNVDANEVCVKQTTKGNWAVYKDGKRICTASKYILDLPTIESYNIQMCD
jgi:hypothetical protein